MGKNSMGGKKAKRAKNHNGLPLHKRVILWAEADQVYGKVEKLLGDMRCSVVCGDGRTRVCKIRGKMKRRVWINAGDIVLVCLREFQDGKGDLIHKYNSAEAALLKEQHVFNPDSVTPAVEGHVFSLDDLVEDRPTTATENPGSHDNGANGGDDLIDFSTI